MEELKITNGLDSMCTVALPTASQELMTAARLMQTVKQDTPLMCAVQVETIHEKEP